MTNPISPTPELLTVLRNIVGDAHTMDSQEICREFSEDLDNREHGPAVVAVVRPRTSQEVSEVLKATAAHGYDVAPRGAGLSYTKGYTPLNEHTVALDLSRMDQIIECNPDDLYLTCEAGTTWQKVLNAAYKEDTRPSMAGPISGSASTVGGAASQNILGSMHGIIGLEVVLSNGDIIQTGSGAVTRSGSNFCRTIGPDATGLFLGDTGSYAVKTKVTLQLEPRPEGCALASFSFRRIEDMASAMFQIARRGLARRLIGMDPIKTRTASKVELGEAGRILSAVAGQDHSLRKRFTNVVSLMRSGRRALDQADWALHVFIDGFDQRSADQKLREVRALCKDIGIEISPNIAIALNARLNRPGFRGG